VVRFCEHVNEHWRFMKCVVFLGKLRYNSREQAVRFAYVTSLRWKKNAYRLIGLRKRKHYLRQRVYFL
jgi:hypothetical protein